MKSSVRLTRSPSGPGACSRLKRAFCRRRLRLIRGQSGTPLVPNHRCCYTNNQQDGRANGQDLFRAVILSLFTHNSFDHSDRLSGHPDSFAFWEIAFAHLNFRTSELSNQLSIDKRAYPHTIS